MALLAFVVIYALHRVRSGHRHPWPALVAALALPFFIPLHLAWLTATAPLFFGPLGEIFAGL